MSRLGDGVGVVGEVLDILKIPNPRIDTKYPNTQILIPSNANLSIIGRKSCEISADLVRFQ